jgi:hypothetical protein
VQWPAAGRLVLPSCARVCRSLLSLQRLLERRYTEASGLFVDRTMQASESDRGMRSTPI